MGGWPGVAGALALIVAAGSAVNAQAGGYNYGNRPIDKLPKSHAARPETERDWAESGPPAGYELKVHPKNVFRIGRRGVERLCVVEARCPEGETGSVALELQQSEGDTQYESWRTEAKWLGSNQRMRPYWLPARLRGRQLLLIEKDFRFRAEAELPLGNPPPVLFELVQRPEPLAVDAGLALPAAWEVMASRGSAVPLRIGVAAGLRGAVNIEVTCPMQRQSTEPPPGIHFRIDPLGSPQTLQIEIPTAGLPDYGAALHAVAQAGDEVLAQRDFVVCVQPAAREVRFGAEQTQLRFTQPVKDGDRERSWDALSPLDSLTDVVVSFPGKPYRLVFWRGASYVPCWALPEAWLCYEWLEAEPYFFGAVDCVEPMMDKDCHYSRVAIMASTPARAVVRWQYALTDFAQKIIRDEYGEETWTIYPDGIGTRYLRGFFQDGWHENQEFIILNRPGCRPSMSLDPQAITFLDTEGHRQTPVWPKPGFSLEGWANTISIVNLGEGPRPFMVTPDAPTQVKVWADPYLEKPDIFNSYPHWPVTRGMLTSWLDDPAQFQCPTHSNLVNLVNSPIRETEAPRRRWTAPDSGLCAVPGGKDKEHEWVWLVGMAESEQQARDVARCWLKPGKVVAPRGLAAKGYSSADRAYLLEDTGGNGHFDFTLVPESGAPIVNPTFIIRKWIEPCRASVAGAQEVRVDRETRVECYGLVIWVRGRFAGPTEVHLQPA